MTSAATERHTSFMLKILFRVAVNLGLVFFLQHTFPAFFVLEGGVKVMVFVGIILTFLNGVIVPVLHLLTFPIKLFAWIVAFFLVNAAALYLTREFVQTLALPGVSLTIQGGVVGWFTLSMVLGFCNWLLKAVVR